jgi:hypothetical protein
MTTFAQLRNGTYDKLLAAGLAGGNVYNSKVTPNLINNLPAIMVQNDKVIAKNIGNATPIFSLDVQLQIICIVSMSDAWANDTDQMVTNVLSTLMTDTEWLALWNNIENYLVDYVVVTDQQHPIGVATITLIGRLI